MTTQQPKQMKESKQHDDIIIEWLFEDEEYIDPKPQPKLSWYQRIALWIDNL